LVPFGQHTTVGTVPKSRKRKHTTLSERYQNIEKKAWKYRSGNQKSQIEEGQTSNWTKEKEQTVKQCSSKHYPEND
jgi:hypothetical protein